MIIVMTIVPGGGPWLWKVPSAWKIIKDYYAGLPAGAPATGTLSTPELHVRPWATTPTKATRRRGLILSS